eukprot:4424800-Amphidinium_carterae.1
MKSLQTNFQDAESVSMETDSKDIFKFCLLLSWEAPRARLCERLREDGLYNVLAHDACASHTIRALVLAMAGLPRARVLTVQTK